MTQKVKSDPSPKKAGLTPSGTRLLLTVVAGGCLAVVLTTPQAILPVRGPSLQFDPAEVAEVMEHDRRAAALAPTDDASERLEALYAEQGRAEVGEGEPNDTFTHRVSAIADARDAVIAADGEEGLLQLRAKVLTPLFEALDGHHDDDDEGALMGSFPRMLERYGAMADGEVQAPPIVVRTLFAARWNGIVQLDLTTGFSPVEIQAYWGWLALGAEGIPLARTTEALHHFVEAHGRHGLEAQAWNAYQAGDMAQAAARYQQASEQTGNTRLRNHAIACQSLIE